MRNERFIASNHPIRGKLIATMGSTPAQRRRFVESVYNDANIVIPYTWEGNPALRDLSCYNNNLTSLDVSGCSALLNLYCPGNNLATLDVTNCTKLKKFEYDPDVKVIDWPK